MSLAVALTASASRGRCGRQRRAHAVIPAPRALAGRRRRAHRRRHGWHRLCRHPRRRRSRSQLLHEVVRSLARHRRGCGPGMQVERGRARPVLERWCRPGVPRHARGRRALPRENCEGRRQRQARRAGLDCVPRRRRHGRGQREAGRVPGSRVRDRARRHLPRRRQSRRRRYVRVRLLRRRRRSHATGRLRGLVRYGRRNDARRLVDRELPLVVGRLVRRGDTCRRTLRGRVRDRRRFGSALAASAAAERRHDCDPRSRYLDQLELPAGVDPAQGPERQPGPVPTEPRARRIVSR